MNKNLLPLLTILEAIEKIKIYTASYTDAQTFFLANDQKEFNAVLNLLIALGEETKKIDESLKAQSSHVEWDAIVGMRNELSHNYRGVDPDVIWNVVVEYLDPLKTNCIAMIKTLNPSKEIITGIVSTVHYQHIRYLITIL